MTSLYRIKFSERADSEFSKLPKEIQQRIIDKLTKLYTNPFRFFIRLKGRIEYKLRVGDYRLIADINRKENTIEVLRIGHRKSVYK